MKMRGCSVLFVCALCVFLLCGAAAVVVVAQGETPEKKAAREAKDKAKTAKEKGDDALVTYEMAGSSLNTEVSTLTTAIGRIGASNGTADTLSLQDQVPSKEAIKHEIWKLEVAATEAKNAVERLVTAGSDSLSNQSKKAELRNKMKEVELNVTEVEQVVAAVTGNISAVIEKAGALETAAEKAMVLWDAAEGKLEEQFARATAAFAAINATKNKIENATKNFINNTSPQTETLNTGLTDVVTDTLAPSLQTISTLISVLHAVKNTAGKAKNEYSELAAKAKELKSRAEERKQKLQPEKREDYSAGPLCSLALPAFFFCWCVLFGV